MNDEASHPLDEAAAADALARHLVEVLRMVRYSDVDEWLEELHRERRNLAFPYVRVTGIFNVDPQFPVIQHLHCGAGFWTAKEYVELRCYCGQVMHQGDPEATGRYKKHRQKILDFCAVNGIEVRAGRWTQAREGQHHA